MCSQEQRRCCRSGTGDLPVFRPNPFIHESTNPAPVASKPCASGKIDPFVPNSGYLRVFPSIDVGVSLSLPSMFGVRRSMFDVRCFPLRTPRFVLRISPPGGVPANCANCPLPWILQTTTICKSTYSNQIQPNPTIIFYFSTNCPGRLIPSALGHLEWTKSNYNKLSQGIFYFSNAPGAKPLEHLNLFKAI
jgi:hypothetical protein